MITAILPGRAVITDLRALIVSGRLSRRSVEFEKAKFGALGIGVGEVEAGSVVISPGGALRIHYGCDAVEENGGCRLSVEGRERRYALCRGVVINPG